LGLDCPLDQTIWDSPRLALTIELTAHQLHAQGAGLSAHHRDDPDILGHHRGLEQVGLGAFVVYVGHKDLWRTSPVLTDARESTPKYNNTSRCSWIIKVKALHFKDPISSFFRVYNCICENTISIGYPRLLANSHPRSCKHCR
jgi:hypothetical protein